MTKVYFVRHAQPEHGWTDDRTRPLTEEGCNDSAKVTEFFRGLSIDSFYCSPYKRSLQTIEGAANDHRKEIIIDERLKERKSGPEGNQYEAFQKRWNDKNYHEDGGESIHMVQNRNIAALKDILEKSAGKTIVIGTHGTALSSVLNYFDGTFDCDSFLRIIDWMPYIVELDFDGQKCVEKTEHLFIHKKFNG